MFESEDSLSAEERTAQERSIVNAYKSCTMESADNRSLLHVALHSCKVGDVEALARIFSSYMHAYAYSPSALDLLLNAGKEHPSIVSWLNGNCNVLEWPLFLDPFYQSDATERVAVDKYNVGGIAALNDTDILWLMRYACRVGNTGLLDLVYPYFKRERKVPHPALDHLLSSVRNRTTMDWITEACKKERNDDSVCEICQRKRVLRVTVSQPSPTSDKIPVVRRRIYQTSVAKRMQKKREKLWLH